MRRIERAALLGAAALLSSVPVVATARPDSEKTLARSEAVASAKGETIWTEQPPDVGPVTPHGLPNLSALVKRAFPAVVSIIVEEASPVALEPSDPLHDFFERFYGESPSEGLGTGFIIHPSGLILTNAHVVEHARKIRVILEDQGYPTEHEATVVGRDSATDLALLRVETGRELPVLPLGDSDTIEIADWVVAIGNPFGLSQSVTFGIVSQTNRTDVTPQGREGYFDFIQTDASINPGNSGGPLLNLRGEVVAINNAINASGQGIGFAVPINMAKQVIPQLAEKGHVTRAWIGLSIQDVSPEHARSIGMKRPVGVVVSEIVGKGPAAKAGIEVGDILLSWNGAPIRGAHRLRWDVACAEVGKKVPVELVRRGKVIRVEVEPTVQPAPERADARPAVFERLGFELGEGGDTAAAVLVGSPVGVAVAEVRPGGVAARAGLRRGDRIVAFGEQPVESAEQLARLVEEAGPGAIVELTIRRGVERRHVTMRVPTG